MKLPFTIYDLRFTIWKKSGGSVSPLTPGGASPANFNRKSSIVNHKSQSGVALVLTLILLSVTLLMALAFLAMSNRERNSAATSTDTAMARLAADAARSAAEAQIAANILSTTNPFSFGLLVSTNHDTDDSLANLGNLFISPRAPVWLTNYVTHAMENRFYLDLNRNGVDDPAGWVPNVDGTVNFQAGDPEWIGLLEHPDQPYGPNNPFIARFLFIALPVGNSLDLNAIHNQVLNPNLSVQDGFFRNQGVGSWVLNLAAFLADLNTNQWENAAAPYAYNEPLNFNSGAAFDDARALLAHRYANNYSSLASAQNLFGANGVAAFMNDIDAYSMGPLQLLANISKSALSPTPQNTALPWAGADNTNHFFTPSDLFDPAKTSGGATAGFTNRLLNAANGVSAYDRYTIYRLLAQMGTDTAPESGKMNLNYDNLDVGTNGVAAVTNFVPWQPLTFFLNAADRLLKTYTAQWATAYYTNNAGVLFATNNPYFLATFNMTNAFGVTDIPVWVSNRYVYTPAVQRLLQLAANIYDATTTNYYPSVFRPLFSAGVNGIYTNVFITGYTYIPNVNPGDINNPSPSSPLAAPMDAASLPQGTNMAANVYGVPWIIGAKKGFPNFNAFSMESIFSLTRKLLLTRPSTTVNFASNPNAYTFAQQLTLGLTNYLGVECWNSYRADYTNARQMEIFATDWSTAVLTNDAGVFLPVSTTNVNAIINKVWPGYGYGTIPQQSSFLVPLAKGNEMVPNLVYTFNPLQPFTTDPDAYFTNITVVPHWGLLITNRLRVIMLEQNRNGLFHIIDYAQLIGPDSGHDLSVDIQQLYDTYNRNDKNTHFQYDDQWDTIINNNTGVTMASGLGNQFSVSAQLTPIILSPYWAQQDPASVTNQMAVFRGFLGLGMLPGMSSRSYNLGKLSLWQQAPYSPTALVAYITKWGANDPLVHYLASDLTDRNSSTAPQKYATDFAFSVLNDRYMPWSGTPSLAPPLADNSFNAVNRYNSAIKDPLVSSSDFWDFPTNKLPTVGRLGGVHRGTPWQTVYLKSADVLSAANGFNTWMNVTGNANPYDAANSAPAQDRLLFDLFTTAFNDNATRGQLSVNIPSPNLAAWSALFSGVVVPTNFTRYTVIRPAAVDVANGVALTNSPLWQLATGINQTRATMPNPDGLAGVFEHVGSILRTPQLSDQSPFLKGLNLNSGISDEMMEWLPQQMMSLLRVGTPRYVIYAYGQGLKPAQGAVFTGGGPFFGMVTNYQVVAETATRVVVRIETTRTNLNDGTIIVTPPHAVIESFNILPPD